MSDIIQITSPHTFRIILETFGDGRQRHVVERRTGTDGTWLPVYSSNYREQGVLYILSCRNQEIVKKEVVYKDRE